MSKTPDNYLQAEQALDDIIRTASSYFDLMERGVTRLTESKNGLDAMDNAATANPPGWLNAVQFIDAQAAAFPADAQWQSLKAKRDKIVTDFQSMQALVASVEAAAIAARDA